MWITHFGNKLTCLSSNVTKLLVGVDGP
jgi:hypothetical protein